MRTIEPPASSKSFYLAADGSVLPHEDIETVAIHLAILGIVTELLSDPTGQVEV